MLKQFFQLSSEDYLLDVFVKLQTQGLRQAIVLRTLGTLLLGLWMFSLNQPYRDFFYFLSLLSVFIGIGLTYFILSDSRYYRDWQPYFLYLLDVMLLTLALSYRPEQGFMLAQTFSVGQNFLPYFFLISLSFLSCNLALISWMLLLSILSWVLAVPLLVNVDFSGALWSLWWQHMLALLVVAGTVIWVLRYVYQTMVQQIKIEREFYDILIQDRQTEDDSKNYIDVLTGFGTRVAFDRDSAQFTKVFSEGRLTDLTIAFINMLNIDSFRAQKGEEAYHQLIREFAKLARQQFRAADMLYYFNNDQFALLAPGASINNAERLRGLLANILAQLKEQGYRNIDAEMGISTLDEVQHK